MSETLRLDKWLWYARFFKSRTMASERIQAGGFRINSAPVKKASSTVRPGDVVTFPLNDHVRVIRIAALGSRRGAAPEAQNLYEDLDPPKAKTSRVLVNPGHDLNGRPTKKAARAIKELRRSALE